MTIATPDWDLTSMTNGCVAARYRYGSTTPVRCGRPSVSRIQFTAECGASGARDLCDRCLDDVLGGRVKCAGHEHPVQVSFSIEWGTR